MAKRRPRALLGVIGLVLLWLVIGAVAGPLSAKLTSVQKNDNASFLPASAEATKALKLQARFEQQDVAPAIVVYERASGITAADRAAAAADVRRSPACPASSARRARRSRRRTARPSK